jgi:hypothetical protein
MIWEKSCKLLRELYKLMSCGVNLIPSNIAVSIIDAELLRGLQNGTVPQQI